MVEAGIRLSDAAGDARAPPAAALARPAGRSDHRRACLATSLRARCGTASARRATSCSASRSCSLTAPIVNAGGKVVKNVAGYDLGKLVCGSRGRLALIGRVSRCASTRVRPRRARSSVETADAACAVARAARLAAAPSALDVLHPGRVASCSRAPSAPSRASGGRRRALVGARAAGRHGVWAESREPPADRPRCRSLRAERPSQHALGAARGDRPPAAVGVAHVPHRVGDRRAPGARRLTRALKDALDPAGVLACGRPRARDRSSQPEVGVLKELTSDCVHCGFCLPTCPTYVLWQEEMDSPRGRIQLMEKAIDGTVTLSPSVVQHFDRCLGCMACVTSCPSGVQYDRLIEETRTRRRGRARPAALRAVAAQAAVRHVAVPAQDARRRSASLRSGEPFPLRVGRAPCSRLRPAGTRASMRHGR